MAAEVYEGTITDLIPQEAPGVILSPAAAGEAALAPCGVIRRRDGLAAASLACHLPRRSPGPP